MNIRKLIVSLIMIFILLNSSYAEDPYWRTRPGGMAAVDFYLPDEPQTDTQTGYYNIDFFIEVTSDPGNDLTIYVPENIRGTDDYIGYYWANQFGFVGSGSEVNGYCGIQTEGQIYSADPNDPQNPASNIFVKQTRLVIFSIWDALDAQSGDEGSYVAPFGHEGSGWSCKLEYDWQPNIQYRIRLYELSDAGQPSEPEWWQGSITNMSSGEEKIIGNILVPGNWGWLQKHTSMFTEYYSTIVNQQIGDEDDGKLFPRISNYIPKAEIKVYPPEANLSSSLVESMAPLTYGKCAISASFSHQDGRVIPSREELAEPAIIIHRSGSLLPSLPSALKDLKLSEKFTLYQNYPNPFNPQTQISFYLQSQGKVTINIYNTIGQKITTLFDGLKTAGLHTLTFNGDGLASGVYFYRIEANGFRSTNKMLYVR